MINVNELYLEVKGKWNSLYPIYFDVNKTIAQGRRLPKNMCIDTPKVQQLAMAVGSLQLRNILEPHKMYSRDYFNIGRVKVQLTNDTHIPLKKDIPNKKALMLKVAQRLKEIRKTKK